MKMLCRTILAAGALLVAGTTARVQAQSSGDGYLFHTPEGRFTLRAGYDHANAGSDVFTQSTDLLTLKKADFSGVTLGAEAAFSLGSRFDVSADFAYTHRSKGSEYRYLIDNNNQPIEQSTTFDRAPLTVNARFYLLEPGRSIGQLAWIPNKVVPWVGAGAGYMYYHFHQTGDFVDYKTNNVFTATDDEFQAVGWTGMYQAMGGTDISLSPHVALRVDARYLWASAPLGSKFSADFHPIDLSGVQGTLGLTYRL